MNIRRLLNTRKNNLKKLRVSKGWDFLPESQLSILIRSIQILFEHTNPIVISVLYNPRSRLINITFILPLGYDFS